MAATAPIQPLAWELPYVGGAPQGMAKRQKKDKKKKTYKLQNKKKNNDKQCVCMNAQMDLKFKKKIGKTREIPSWLSG